MKRLLVSIVFALSIALPVMAQDETPTVELSTPVATETVAPEPTLAPTEPAPVEPAPVDTAAVPEWIFVVVIVLVVGVVSIALVAIIQAAKSWPPAAKELLLSFLNTGVGELDKVAAGTETEIDNIAVAELRKRVAELEAALRVVQQKVN